MHEIDQINNLIEHGHENDYLDFKAIQFRDKESFIKDVISMANSSSKSTKYIIYGIKVSASNKKEILGIESSIFKDSSEIQQLVYANIEPDLDVDYIAYNYNGKSLAILKIDDTQNKPYLLRKDLGKSKKGFCFVRKGSQQALATREDFDQFYSQNEKIDLLIQDPILSVTDDKGIGRMDILLRNHSNNPTTILDGKLEIFSPSGDLLSIHSLYGFDHELTYADFTYELKPKTEKYGECFLGFSSTDCLRLNMNDTGYVENLNAIFTLLDSADRIHTQAVSNFSVCVKGPALWKVKQPERKKKSRKKLFR